MCSAKAQRFLQHPIAKMKWFIGFEEPAGAFSVLWYTGGNVPSWSLMKLSHGMQ
jgi:hypothetical protein